MLGLRKSPCWRRAELGRNATRLPGSSKWRGSLSNRRPVSEDGGGRGRPGVPFLSMHEPRWRVVGELNDGVDNPAPHRVTVVIARGRKLVGAHCALLKRLFIGQHCLRLRDATELAESGGRPAIDHREIGVGHDRGKNRIRTANRGVSFARSRPLKWILAQIRPQPAREG